MTELKDAGEMKLSENELPKISVVMPSYNRRERLAWALSHLAKQTYPAHLTEVVVVLDGCTDGSADLLEQLRPTFPFTLNLVEQPQSGPGAARNAGVRAAKGEYIVFIDDDVMATPELLREHWQIHHNDPRAVVIGPMSTPADHVRPVWVRWEEYILEGQYQDLLNHKYELTPRQFYTGNCSLKRSWIVEAGMFDETFRRYEDVELAFRLEELGVRFYFNPKAVGYHYANRSLESWKNAHYLYGRYAVKIGREKGYFHMIEVAQEEFARRHWLTRLLATKLLNRKAAQRFTTNILLRIAELACRLKQERRGYQALSSIANMLYWQGFNEELHIPASTSSATVKAGI